MCMQCVWRCHACVCNAFEGGMHVCAMHLEVACMCVQCVCCWSKNELNESEGSEDFPMEMWMYLMASPSYAHQTGGRALRWLGSRSRELSHRDENSFRATKGLCFCSPLASPQVHQKHLCLRALLPST